MREAKLNRWIVVYIIVGIIALIIGLQTVPEPFDRISLMKDQTVPLLIFFIIQMSVKDWGAFRRVLLALLLPIPYVFRVTYNQYSNVASWHYSHDLRISGPLGLGANELGAYCVSAALLALGLLMVAKQKYVRGLLALFAILASLCIMYSYSRGAYVAFLAGASVLIFYHPKRLKIGVFALLIAITSANFLPVSVVERFEMINANEDTGVRDDSAESRFELWEYASDLYSRDPIFGVGFGSFRFLNPFGKDAHNYYILTLVERGSIGMLVLFILLAKIMLLARRLAKNKDQNQFGFGLSLSMVAMTTAMAIGNMFGDRFSHYPMIIIFWGSLALLTITLKLNHTEDSYMPLPDPHEEL